jgi:hypothetical protein
LLVLARNHDVQAHLERRLYALLELGELPDPKVLFDEFAPRLSKCSVVVVRTPSVSLYDLLVYGTVLGVEILDVEAFV